MRRSMLSNRLPGRWKPVRPAGGGQGYRPQSAFSTVQLASGSAARRAAIRRFQSSTLAW